MEKLVDFIMDHKQIVDDRFVKSNDSGQGPFTISLAIIPNNYGFEIDRPLGEPLE